MFFFAFFRPTMNGGVLKSIILKNFTEHAGMKKIIQMVGFTHGEENVRASHYT
jgi:hypothetical protein